MTIKHSVKLMLDWFLPGLAQSSGNMIGASNRAVAGAINENSDESQYPNVVDFLIEKVWEVIIPFLFKITIPSQILYGIHNPNQMLLQLVDYHS